MNAITQTIELLLSKEATRQNDITESEKKNFKLLFNKMLMSTIFKEFNSVIK